MFGEYYIDDLDLPWDYNLAFPDFPANSDEAMLYNSRHGVESYWQNELLRYRKGDINRQKFGSIDIM